MPARTNITKYSASEHNYATFSLDLQAVNGFF